MSYARFGYKDSDVYVFLAVDGWLECCACALHPASSHRAYSTANMVSHLSEHRRQGHVVPNDTFALLAECAVENDDWMARTENETQ